MDTITDYDRYLDGLMADCQRSVQRSCYQCQAVHTHQYCASPHSFKEPRTAVPPPSLPSGPLATIATPATCISGKTPPAAIYPYPKITQNVLTAADAPRFASSGNLSLGASAPSPFHPLFPSPIPSSTSSSTWQYAHVPTASSDHAVPRQGPPKAHIQTEPDKETDMCYRYMLQRTLKIELKKRGLRCGGPNGDLVKRLEKDDEFQAEARTAENYDTMNPEDISSLCVRRSISSNGTDRELRDRLKFHDNRRYGFEVAEPRVNPLILPSWPVSALENKDSRGMREEKCLAPGVKDVPMRVTETAENSEQTPERGTSAISRDFVGFKPINGILPGQNIDQECNVCGKSKWRCMHDTNGNEEMVRTVQPAELKNLVELEPETSMPLTQDRRVSCDNCRQKKRRCTHDRNGNKDPARAITGLVVQNSALAVEEVLPAENLPGSCAMRSRISTATGLAPESEAQRQDGCCIGKRRCEHDMNDDEKTVETVQPIEPTNGIALQPRTGILLPNLQVRSIACGQCRKNKRRCIHDEFGNEDIAKANEPVVPRPTARKSHIQASTGLMVKNPAMSAKNSEGKPVTRLRMSIIKASTSQSELKRSAEIEQIKDVESKVIETTIPGPTACKTSIQDSSGPMVQNPTLAVESLDGRHVTRSCMSTTEASTSQSDLERPAQTGHIEDDTKGKAIDSTILGPTTCEANIKDNTGSMVKNPALAVDDTDGTHVTRSRVSTAKASVSGIELTRPAQPKLMEKHIERKPKSRRSQLYYQPKDEVMLLRICVNLKEVFAWKRFHGFWNTVQDTLQLKTGKPYKKVSRHVQILVRKRRAERGEIEQHGKISKSRLTAGCRPLLDKWIAGGNQARHVSPNTSITSSLSDLKDDVSLVDQASITSSLTELDDDVSLVEEASMTSSLTELKDDVSFVEEARQQVDSDDSALEVQKRSATDAWLDTSCDTMRSKKVRLCTSELSHNASKPSIDSVGCWSLSGSNVTSESSVEDEAEGDREGDVKNGGGRGPCD